ncbi:hypothetical protein CEXT_239951 [Caerostris extrusa]|uniref:Uncharacterized protein n=1 Tax=Caerostris extrusa TaxID=172846 RepID=A0AAV4XHZ8_CAEEX|nr:hypothetical protein CEXT_239951 [Caerostris extrusa]
MRKGLRKASPFVSDACAWFECLESEATLFRFVKRRVSHIVLIYLVIVIVPEAPPAQTAVMDYHAAWLVKKDSWPDWKNSGLR